MTTLHVDVRCEIDADALSLQTLVNIPSISGKQVLQGQSYKRSVFENGAVKSMLRPVREEEISVFSSFRVEIMCRILKHGLLPS